MLARRQFRDLFGEMNRIQHEMHHLFGRAAQRVSASVPLVNVWEDEHAIYAQTDLPGVRADALDIQVTEGNVLTIQGERQPVTEQPATWHRQERGHGAFARTLTLPTLVDADKVEAKLERGVLLVTLPKAEAAKPRKIAVASGR